MKIVAFSGVPFHRWCLEDVVPAARNRGHEVVEIEHRPQHAHHWWTGSAETCSALAAAAANADFIVVADYPYAPIRSALRVGAKIVSVRHSLASRGNTYEPEQFEADVVPVFSEYDEKRLIASWNKHRTPSARTVTGPTMRNVGCSWAVPVLSTDRAGSRAVLLDRVGLRHDDPRPIVAVATTWNPWTSLDAVRELAADRDRIVIWRPHWAAAWRRPGELDEVRSFGAYVDDPLEHPSTLLLGSDVLVGDVSGIVMLATMVRDVKPPRLYGGQPAGGLPVVMIDPDPSALLDSGQLDPTGPEWEFRDRIGPRLSARRAPGEVAEAVSRLLVGCDEWRGSRAWVGEAMSAPHTTPDSPERLIEALTR